MPGILRYGGIFVVAVSMSLGAACSGPEGAPRPVDPRLDAGARRLFDDLWWLRGRGILFGHQDDTAYGVEWFAEPGRSDVRETAGDYPAVYGWDIGGLERGDAANLDGVDFALMRVRMIEAHRRGGINAVSWHMFDPISGASSWHDQPVVEHLLPGAPHHAALRAALDRFVEFNAALQREAGDDGPVPLIFRPWHEHNGDWFWWGRRHTREADYIALWRITLQYLRDEKGVHNLLWAWSPDRSRLDPARFEETYFYAYPGDDAVDLLGLDDYWDLGHPANAAGPDEQRAAFVDVLGKLVRAAEARGKLAALTEGGRENIGRDDFWTAVLGAGLLADGDTRKLSYALVWRNANRAREGRDHYFGPWPGHPSAEDFRRFAADPWILLESEAAALLTKRR
ncbi:MAG: mannan endo-1,4-beta-mannosidase [Gammaproteobacteria bacterium]|nr:MAG: mannan endo-1,4-beta-mannosidase [Gammaproteobacteria bacterium]